MEVKFKEKKLEKSNLVKALFTVYFTEQGGHKISSEIEMGLGKGKQETTSSGKVLFIITATELVSCVWGKFSDCVSLQRNPQKIKIQRIDISFFHNHFFFCLYLLFCCFRSTHSLWPRSQYCQTCMNFYGTTKRTHCQTLSWHYRSHTLAIQHDSTGGQNHIPCLI